MQVSGGAGHADAVGHPNSLPPAKCSLHPVRPSTRDLRRVEDSGRVSASSALSSPYKGVARGSVSEKVTSPVRN